VGERRGVCDVVVKYLRRWGVNGEGADVSLLKTDCDTLLNVEA